MYKSLNDVKRVIDLKKSDKVIDMFVSSYLIGLQFEEWKKQKKEEYYTLYPEYEILTDDEGNDTQNKLEYDHTFETWLESETVTQETVEAVYDDDGMIVTPTIPEIKEKDHVFESVEPDVTAWRLQNYAMLRKPHYGTAEEQLEMQFDGTWNDHVLSVKERFPK